ncbi:hypothetical protein ACEQ8H_004102 [Pleosporales sp. CAS-2024a]
MTSFMQLATLALATGLAAAGPIAAPVTKRDSIFGNGFNGAVLNGFSGNGFNFGSGFNNLNQQAQVIQIQQENLQIVNNGFQQQVVDQVNQVLVVDQVSNGFNQNLNNLFRKATFQNQFRDKTTVMLVVQEIQIAVADPRGNQLQQSIFAQKAVVANRGQPVTQTVMIFDTRKLVAHDVLANNAFARIAQQLQLNVNNNNNNNTAPLPTKTQAFQLLAAKPTWSTVAPDPAATLAPIWQQSLQDLQSGANDAHDAQLNAHMAALEKQRLDLQANMQNGNGNATAPH